MKSRWRKAAVTFLQVGVTLAILWLVFRDPSKRDAMFRAVLGANPWWLLAGFLVYGLVEFLSGLRWQMLLRVQGVIISWPRVFALLMIGVFFNFFVPGGTGGDMVKVFYLFQETPGQRAKALLSVLVDRVVGVFALVVLAAILIALHWPWLAEPPATSGYVWITLAILAAIVAGLVFSFAVTGFGLVHRLPTRFPLRARLAELALAYHSYARAWRTTLAAFIISIITHLSYFYVFYCAARSFGTSGTRIPSVGELFAVMPIVNTITAMPVSLGGVGVREGLFEVFLHSLCGVSQAVAVLISSTGYLLTLTWGLMGGLIYMFYRPTEHARLAQMRRTVEDFEERVAVREMAAEKRGGS